MPLSNSDLHQGSARRVPDALRLRRHSEAVEPHCDFTTLALRHRPDRLRLRHGNGREELAASRGTPATLASKEVGNRHRLRLHGAIQDDACCGEFPITYTTFELG